MEDVVQGGIQKDKIILKVEDQGAKCALMKKAGPLSPALY